MAGVGRNRREADRARVVRGGKSSVADPENAHDGCVEIDTNRCENTIRPTAVGKKNWLFIGAEGAGQNSAILFTLVAECRRLGLNPQAYFTTALTRLPSANTSDVVNLTPDALAPLLLGSEKTPAANVA